MRVAIVFGALLLATSLYAGNEHGTCSEDGFVAFPLHGWVGYTNTGQSQSGMMVECFTNPDEPPIASTKTDAAGRFLFPRLKPGKYYLKATKRLPRGWVVRADDIVIVSDRSHGIACLVAEAEEPLLELRLTASQLSDGLPQLFTFEVVNTSDHPVLLPPPEPSCGLNGTVRLEAIFTSLKGDGAVLGGACGSNRGFPPILERLKSWRRLEPGESLSVAYSHKSSRDFGKAQGTYDFGESMPHRN